MVTEPCRRISSISICYICVCVNTFLLTVVACLEKTWKLVGPQVDLGPKSGPNATEVFSEVVVRGVTCGHTSCQHVIVKEGVWRPFKHLYPYIIGSIPKILKLLKNKSFQRVAALMCRWWIHITPSSFCCWWCRNQKIFKNTLVYTRCSETYDKKQHSNCICSQKMAVCAS